MRLIGPNCPGVLSPGKANVGIIPAAFFKEGNVGVVSRSGTLTYQIGNELAQRGFGNSTHRRHRRRPGARARASSTCIELFEADAETELIVMAGEIGGSAEEEAAEYIAEQRHQAGRRLHRRLHRAARQDDGPRRRDRLGLPGTAQAKAEALEASGRARRAHADRGVRHRRRARSAADAGRCWTSTTRRDAAAARRAAAARGLFGWLFSGDGWPYLLRAVHPAGGRARAGAREPDADLLRRRRSA